MPAKVDAIVVLGGPGDRVDYAMQLARENRAPYLVFSKGLGRLPPGICTEHVGSATVLCFQPNPLSAQSGYHSRGIRGLRQAGETVLMAVRCPGHIPGTGLARQTLVRPLLPL